MFELIQSHRENRLRTSSVTAGDNPLSALPRVAANGLSGRGSAFSGGHHTLIEEGRGPAIPGNVYCHPEGDDALV